MTARSRIKPTLKFGRTSTLACWPCWPWAALRRPPSNSDGGGHHLARAHRGPPRPRLAWEKETGNTVEIVSLPWGRPSRRSRPWSRAGDIPDVVEMPDRWLALYSRAPTGSWTSRPIVEDWEDGTTLTDQTVAMGSQTADRTSS